jgi:hypothetical protein
VPTTPKFQPAVAEALFEFCRKSSNSQAAFSAGPSALPILLIGPALDVRVRRADRRQ